jgi:preprotein translocase subunit SecA
MEKRESAGAPAAEVDEHDCGDPECGEGHAGVPFRREAPKLGRNDPCACGSGKKYKKCCLGSAA